MSVILSRTNFLQVAMFDSSQLALLAHYSKPVVRYLHLQLLKRYKGNLAHDVRSPNFPVTYLFAVIPG